MTCQKSLTHIGAFIYNNLFPSDSAYANTTVSLKIVQHLVLLDSEAG